MNTKQMSISINSRVEVIPATKCAVKAGGRIKEMQKLRVAAYCRVSTGDESQQTSYTKQCEYYTELIEKKVEWIMAGIYADEAITGTSRAKRKQFNHMMDDAEAGKIDYIVTKSISRFARNTVDTLNCVRQLRNQNPPVGVFFEKENIDTLDAKGELILTILSAMAQDESRSISDNIRWTFQKKFQEGKPQVNLKRMLGYDAGPDREWVINPEQAEIVRTIFEQYLCGYSANRVAEILNKAGKKTVNGKLWRADTVLNILRNEKYVGDIEMQKTITKDYLTHQSVVNNGEAPKYYVKDHHVGIIDRFTWDRTQALLMSRNKRCEEKTEKKVNNDHPLTNMVCGICNAPYRRTAYSNRIAEYTDERSLESRGLSADGFKEFYTYSYMIWRCQEKYEGHRKAGRLSDSEREHFETQCASKIIYEAAVEQSFMEMIYGLKREYEAVGNEAQFVRDFRMAYEKLYERCCDLSVILKRNFDLFLKCILALPETNKAGMKMHIGSLDAGEVPDFLDFDKGLYLSFFPKATVKGNTIEYVTNFGVKLVSTMTDRKLSDFLGYRKCSEDGTAAFITHCWQVSGRSVQYNCRARKGL